MKLNQTQRHVLRYIFGYNDGAVQSKGHSMPLRRGSREHQFAKELSANGLGEFFVRGNILYIKRPHTPSEI